MVNDARQIIVRIDGELAKDGKVPITLLADKLMAIQRLLYNTASSFVGGGRRGSWKSEVLEACSLQFLGARMRCLDVVAEVPLQTQLKLPTMDLGYRSVEKLIDTLEAMRDRDKHQLDKLFPDFRHRSRILKSAPSLLPEEESD